MSRHRLLLILTLGFLVFPAHFAAGQFQPLLRRVPPGCWVCQQLCRAW
jgi:hypothetical protein